MAFVEEFRYDIFISYSHKNNRENYREDKGWVYLFCEKLKFAFEDISPNKNINIWWDQNLDSTQKFNVEIEKSINDAAIFIALNSKHYAGSPYCQTELNHFYKKALSRVYGPNVECISVVPDHLQAYPDENLLVINHDISCIQTETDKNVSMRIPGGDFAGMVSKNFSFRRLMEELQRSQEQVPVWMFENRSEFEYCCDDHVLLLGPRPELAEKFNNKVWQ